VLGLVFFENAEDPHLLVVGRRVRGRADEEGAVQPTLLGGPHLGGAAARGFEQLREVLRPDVLLGRLGPGVVQVLREPDQQLVDPQQLPVRGEARQEAGHHTA
jgi:hypothetical protein